MQGASPFSHPALALAHESAGAAPFEAQGAQHRADAAQRGLAACLDGLPQNIRGDAAQAMLACVHDGHADFTNLEPRFRPGLARLTAHAIEILDRHAGGIVNFTLPDRLGACAGYDPAAFARHLNASAPRLAYLTLPAPAGASATLDLRALCQRPAPAIHILRVSTSKLLVLLDKRAEAPTSSATLPLAGDPLAAGPSRILWMAGDGKVVRRDKLSNAYYHHTASKTGDRVVDEKRQREAIATELNCKAQFPSGELIVCGDLDMHMSQAWRGEMISRELGFKAEAVDGQHPALQGLGSIDEIAQTVAPGARAALLGMFKPGGWLPCSGPTFGKTLARLFRGDVPGSERIFMTWVPGTGGDTLAHGMLVRVRVKGEPGKPRYSLRFYDPNLTKDWGRGFCDSLADLAKVSLGTFIRREWRAGYFRPMAPVCAIKEWPEGRELVGDDDEMPQSLRATPENLWAASLAGPEQLRSALEDVLVLPRKNFPLADVNPVFNKMSLLARLVAHDERATAIAFIDTIAMAFWLLPSAERAGLAMTLVRDVLAHARSEAVCGLLRPLVGLVRRDALVHEVLESSRSDDDQRAIFASLPP